MFVKTIVVLSFAILGLAAPLLVSCPSPDGNAGAGAGYDCMFCLIIMPLNKLNQLHAGPPEPVGTPTPGHGNPGERELNGRW
jgi:hypothetical protein